ncbi:MAG: ECF-type sigma factor [Pseudoxanthomonas sp.]|nr:ECF-type sigma factor [Pseudoxanthomonas sp.]
MEPGQDITVLLARARAGDAAALEVMLPRVYHELRALARRHLAREAAGHTLCTTALVHEAYLKLAGGAGDWRDRAHFFGYAAAVMRNILVDHARRRGAVKRGGDRIPVDWSLAEPSTEAVAEEVLALDEALGRLAALDPDLARVVELRFFAGLSLEETAEVTGRSPRTVDRDWAKARAFLHQVMA